MQNPQNIYQGTSFKYSCRPVAYSFIKGDTFGIGVVILFVFMVRILLYSYVITTMEIYFLFGFSVILHFERLKKNLLSIVTDTFFAVTYF